MKIASMRRSQHLLTQLTLNRHLKYSRQQLITQPDSARLQKLYQRYRPQLLKLYAQTYYWHGTGFYQYGVQGDKYTKIDFSCRRHILVEILNYGGLKPHFDQWLTIGGRPQHSLSVTKLRLYARLYVQLHQIAPANNPAFYYGDRHSLIRFFVIYMLLEMGIVKFLRGIYRAFTDPFFRRSGADWARVANSQVKSAGNAMRDLINILGDSNSDIHNNFGVLIGLKKSAIRHPAKIDHSALALTETRSLQPISLRHFTHLEVPLSHMSKVKKLLAQHHLSLPVIPLEVGELFASEKDGVTMLNAFYAP